MTIRIPLRALLFVLYTAAVLGGAFGISYAVFEWREDGGESDGSLTLESLDARIDNVDGRVDSVSSRVSGLSTSSGSNDSSVCHGDLRDLILVVNNKFAGTISGAVLEQEVKDVVSRVFAHC